LRIWGEKALAETLQYGHDVSTEMWKTCLWKGFERSWRGLEKRLVQPEKEMTERESV
jgi:hypothetical protein